MPSAKKDKNKEVELSPAVVPNAKYEEKDIVICLDNGPRGTGSHFHCNVVQVRYNEEAKQAEYRIHWRQWSSKYDEWMLETDPRLKPNTDENIAIIQAEKLEKSLKRKSKGGGRGSGASTPCQSASNDNNSQNSEPVSVTKKRAKLAGTVSDVQTAVSEAGEFDIEIPDAIKDCLVDDHNMINERQHLLSLPARVTVDEIVADFNKYIDIQADIAPIQFDQRRCSSAKEVVAGLSTYFNYMLASRLLYKFERPQLDEYLAKHKTQSDAEPDNTDQDMAKQTIKGTTVRASSHYGYAHLVRFFTRMGWALSISSFTDSSLMMIEEHTTLFLQFLASHRKQYWNVDTDYNVTTIHYQKQAYDT